MNIARRVIESHLVEGKAEPGSEIGLRIDQTLTQDATGTLVMLQLEAIGLERVRTELSAQYVDHNLVQSDHRNADDHLFLHSACQRFGVWYSRPGNGVSHAVHQERFGVPGKTLLGSDSHTPAAGALGMLAIGAGGIEVALAMAGEPFFVRMPQIWGIELVGELPPWSSAKDVILELLRRHGVTGARGFVLEYHGDGLDSLSVMDRHVIANMGTELGATSSVFPSDDAVRRYLRSQKRENDWTELVAGTDARYDREEVIDLSEIEPLIAMPSSPGNVRRVRDVVGETIHQAYIGSSANPGYRDIAIVAAMVAGRQVPPWVSLDINPASRQTLDNLIRDGHLGTLLRAGARLHQTGCNGCIGMGQAPATGKLSLRTVPRNFPGRSGTREDRVCLVSPETAAASALEGKITDPRDLGVPYPEEVREPDDLIIHVDHVAAPPSPEEARTVEIQKGPNIAALPELDPLPNRLELPVLLEVGDDISTDEIMPAGARALPYRSSIPEISKFVFESIDADYAPRARERDSGHVIVAGHNYGQGSSREHAALAPRFLGLRVVIAKSFARIHWQNLVNYGVLPLTFEDESDRTRLGREDTISIDDLHDALGKGHTVTVRNTTRGESIRARHDLSPRQIEIVLAGGLINRTRRNLDAKAE